MPGKDTTLTRYDTTIGGDLSITIGDDDVVTLAISNPNGDVVTTVPLTGDQTGLDISGWSQFDECGNQLSTPANTGVTSYGWKGAAQCVLDAGSGLILMGARLYNPVTGSFTSIDPVAGGNSTACGYPQDPINEEDLDGLSKKWAKAKKWWGRHGSTVTGALKLGLAAASLFACTVCAVAGAVSMAWGAYDVYKAKGARARATAMIGFVPVAGKFVAKARMAKNFKRNDQLRSQKRFSEAKKYKKAGIRWQNRVTPVTKVLDRAVMGWDTGSYAYSTRRNYSRR